MDMSGKVVTATLWGEDVSPCVDSLGVLVPLGCGALAPEGQRVVLSSIYLKSFTCEK